MSINLSKWCVNAWRVAVAAVGWVRGFCAKTPEKSLFLRFSHSRRRARTLWDKAGRGRGRSGKIGVRKNDIFFQSWRLLSVPVDGGLTAFPGLFGLSAGFRRRSVASERQAFAAGPTFVGVKFRPGGGWRVEKAGGC